MYHLSIFTPKLNDLISISNYERATLDSNKEKGMNCTNSGLLWFVVLFQGEGNFLLP